MKKGRLSPTLPQSLMSDAAGSRRALDPGFGEPFEDLLLGHGAERHPPSTKRRRGQVVGQALALPDFAEV